MIKNLFLLFLSLLLHYTAFASEEIKVFFYVDHEKTPLPTSILKNSENINESEISQYLIHELIKTESYQSVSTNQYLDNQNNTFYIVTATTSQSINSITLIGVSSEIQYQLQRTLDTEIGKAYNPTILTRLKKRVETELRKSGYLSAKVVTIEPSMTSSNDININIKVDSGKECIIQQIVMPTAYLNFLQLFDFPIDVGSPCNLPVIEDGLSQIQEEYKSDGYLQAVVAIDRIDYTPQKDKAIVYVKIDVGKKTILQINDYTANVFKSDFLDPKAGGLTYSDLNTLSDFALRTAIIDFYQAQGFAAVRVSPPKRYKDKKNENNIISFDVVKGEAAKINDVFFLGDPLPLSQAEILDELKIKKNMLFNKDSLIVYKESFKKILYSYGYNDASVSDLDFYFSPDKTLVNIIIKYKRGTQFIVSSISYSNFPPKIKIPKKLYKSILKPGDPASFAKSQEIEENLKNILLEHGYLYAVIEDKISPQNTKKGKEQTPVHVVFQAIPGSLVRIRKILVEGDSFEKQYIIKSISDLKINTIFTQEKLNNAQKNILKHDLFSSVSIDFLDPQTLEKKDPEVTLVIKVRGKKGFNFSLTPAYGSGSGYRTNTNFSINNITKHGLRLNLDATVQQEVQQQQPQLTPSKQLLGQNYSIGLSEALVTVLSIQTPFDVTLAGTYQIVAGALQNSENILGNFNTEWKPTIWGADTTFSVNFNYMKSRSLSPDNKATEIFDPRAYNDFSIDPALKVDSRDNAGWPTKGIYFVGSMNISREVLASDLNYTSYNASLKYYYPIYKRLSGAVYFGINQVRDIKSSLSSLLTVPVNKRNFLSGDALIRGFPNSYIYTQLGPLLWLHATPADPNDKNTICNTLLQSIGGTQLAFLKLEARYRINQNLGLVAFGDSGTTYFTTNETTSLRSAVQGLTANPNQPIVQAGAGTSCVFDNAAFVPTPAINGKSSIINQYWNKTYMSAGLGVRIILGSFMSINVDYGYPFKDPSSINKHPECITIADAQSTATAPRCIDRIQDSHFIFEDWKYKGAFNFGVEAIL